MSANDGLDALKKRLINNLAGLGHDIIDYTNYRIQGPSANVDWIKPATQKTECTSTQPGNGAPRQRAPKGQVEHPKSAVPPDTSKVEEKKPAIPRL